MYKLNDAFRDVLHRSFWSASDSASGERLLTAVGWKQTGVDAIIDREDLIVHQNLIASDFHV